MTTYRGRIITFTDSGKIEDFEGYMQVEQGIIKKISKEKITGEYEDYRDYLILPGFIDTHLHLPQVAIRGKWSDDLLKWLENYVFPEEKRFLDEDYAEKMSRRFFGEIVRNGTTSAMVYGPPNRESTETAYEIADEYGINVFMGQTLMDMNVPEELKTSAKKAVEDVKYMAERRKNYVLTLRFAPSCSMELMRETAKIAKSYNLRIQTHISEQKGEIEMVKEIFNDTYGNVYDTAGVLTPKTVLAHGIHLSEEELRLISFRGSKIAHCPSSNFFLHSGIMKMKDMRNHGISVGLGSDIAGGPYINMMEVMRDAYYANPLSPMEIFRLLTLGGAEVLAISDVAGTLEPGKYGDFTIVKYEGETTEEILAELVFYGNENRVIATYSHGRLVWGK